MKNICLSLALIGSLSIANADQMPKKMFPLGSVHSTNGMVLPKGKFIDALKVVFVDKDEVYDGNDKLNTPAKPHVKVQRYNLIARYGVGNGFDFRALIPYFRKSLNNKMLDIDNSGIGDMRVFGRYQLTSQKMGSGFFSAIDLGLELPTGKTNKNFKNKKGMKMPNHQPIGMQLGDGSVDFIFGLSATKLMLKHRLDASAMYIYNHKGKNDFKAGNKFDYNLAYSYLVHPWFMPSLEINGKHSSKNEYKGKLVNTSGGDEIFATLGVSAHITKSLKLQLAYSLPIYRDLNKGTLGTKNMITAKLSYVW